MLTIAETEKSFSIIYRNETRQNLGPKKWMKKVQYGRTRVWAMITEFCYDNGYTLVDMSGERPTAFPMKDVRGRYFPPMPGDAHYYVPKS